MEEKAVAIIHVGRPLSKGDIGNLIPKAEIINDNMDCQGGAKLDYLAEHLMNGPCYARRPFGDTY